MRIRWFSLVRIIGMLMVLLYHFFTDIFRGGFVGVDLFFTVSGFLTTAMFLDEFGKRERIDLMGFLRKRLYRILPPLVLMVLLIMPFALLIRHDFLADIGTQIAAAVGFVTNYFEISLGGSYENQFVPHLFLHTWSLAVEVHLYLFWGLLLWALSKRSKTTEQLRKRTFVLAIVFFLITFSRMVLGAASTGNLSEVYYASGSHSFPFFIGAGLASLTGVGQATALLSDLVQSWPVKRTLSVLGGGFALLVGLMFLLDFNNLWTYWLGFLLASLAASAMLLAARILHEQSSRQEPKILGFLANISYGLYLFHWPLFIIFGELVGKGLLAVLLTLVFSGLFASLSFYLIEPLLMGRPARIMGADVTFVNAGKVLAACLGPLTLLTLIVILISPKMGALETDLMVGSLQQADSKMTQTRTLVDNQQATDYGVLAGTMIIGDSVTLRASEGLTANIPGILVDGVVSRTLEGAYEVMQANIANGSLPQNVVIAAGTNPTDNYADQLDKIVSDLPQGHRLILVTPYDGRTANDTSATPNQIRDYELKLADKYEWVTVADWYQAAVDNPQIWQNTDQVHFGNDSESITAGQNLYAQILSQALSQADSQPVKTGKNK